MKKSILVIDDDRLVSRSVERYLKSCGYNVETAQSGNEALEKIKSLDCDLIISDVRMPGIDGLEMLRRVRESNGMQGKKQIPAIIITAYAGDVEFYKKAGELGIAEYIYKPFSIGELAAVIRKVLELPPQYQRAHPRVEMSFPIAASVQDCSDPSRKTIRGDVTDLSEDGIGLSVDGLLPRSSVVDLSLNSSPRYTLFRAQALAVWSKPFLKDGAFRAGLHFLKMEDAYLSILMEILAEYKIMNKGFIDLVQDSKRFLEEVKGTCDKFDKGNSDPRQCGEFIETNKKAVFERLDAYFERIWTIIKDLEKDAYAVHQHYYQHVLGHLLLDPIEINRHVYQKPLGYSGDYLMMNYIYDYHKDNYLGHSSFEKLINHYTCNIPISVSNNRRKDLLKEKISEALGRKEKTRICSFACGPARELLELLKEGRITSPLVFYCFDAEKKALEYIDAQINKIGFPQKQLLSMGYICRDVTAVIRDKELKKILQNQDLIYALGIFDYLSEKMASRLVSVFYELLQEGGKLLIFNANVRNSGGRAYYELLGGWHLIYRTEEQMLKWAKDIKGAPKIRFEEFSKSNSYLCLSIEK